MASIVPRQASTNPRAIDNPNPVPPAGAVSSATADTGKPSDYVIQRRVLTAGDITPEQDAAIKASIPMGIVGDPMDIANGSLYLASDDARYVTGAELWIDGGWYAGS